MRNAPCTPLSPDEEAAIMSAFPVPLLTPEEDRDAAKLFKRYVFYETRQNRSRDCYCTSCGRRYNVSRKGHADFFKASHKGALKGSYGYEREFYACHEARMKAACPECGAESEIVAAGKFQNFRSLTEHVLVVRLSARDGWLLAQAGVVVREFGRGDCYGEIANAGAVTQRREFHEFRRFAFRPGRRNEWQLKGVWNNGGEDFTVKVGAADFLPESRYCYRKSRRFAWTPTKSVGEAHYPAPYTEASYFILNPDALSESDMRYCQFFQWFECAYGYALGDDSTMHAHFCAYLSEYTRRPQMEMLVKLGYAHVVSDLILNGVQNRSLLNWKADNPADFFRVSKADFRALRNADCGAVDLKLYRSALDGGLVQDLKEFVEVTGGAKLWTEKLLDLCAAHALTLRRVAAYWRGYASRTGTEFPVVVTLWKDYLTAAQKLDYDLTREDVLLPRNLSERHDAATRTVTLEAEETKRKQYRSLYQRLCKRYEYGADGLRIVVPRDAADIINEGKTLRHCVGGYAARHMEGKATILFLRRTCDLAAPYATIEMTTETNPRKLSIVQIHGYCNDVRTQSPLKTHGDFLAGWLEWVHEGSPRDSAGRPVAPGNEG